MAGVTDNPLSEEQKDELIQKIKDCDAVQIQIDNAKRAGVDVADQQKQLNDARAQLKKIKDVYAPNRSIL